MWGGEGGLGFLHASMMEDFVCVFLQSVSEKLVELGNLARDAEVDGPVANLDNEASDDIGVDLERRACQS